MAQWYSIDPVRHQVAIAGQVRNAQSGKAIAGALVRIAAGPQAFTNWLALQRKQYAERWDTMPERPDRMLTAADGHFHFLDLPVGSYTLEATLPGQGSRYGTVTAKLKVVREGSGIKMVTAEIVVPPTTLRGQITGRASGAPIAMTQVRVQGSGETVFCDRQGNYRLTGLETGTRTVLAVVKGYQTASTSVALGPAGVEQRLDFTLDPATP